MSDLNDPRVFFAAERTLLAWTRTALALMAFGFAIERFALFVAMMHNPQTVAAQVGHGSSFWIGVALIALGSLAVVLAVVQYRRVLATLKPVEIPDGYMAGLASWTSLAVGVIGIALIVQLFSSR
ncbi:hypothetical protein METUNv1_01228 [Methyloversatilis universalis FAM5]|jgi:putative membrane protein|uniref:DUF202 domain-containing protein n=1 Tax=Methyloversatilis universalis (strain ATCC BAA-1314 / DSM 25237 / JCM 13912 / CCUG 52030 / FAM5) TaxID=1000565 RepID=F5RAL4_METUF|nr:DUF202 domain-containing protein [Methyloversatilis universalis]EGK72463.1 hypothetical protein METUNv1_01228 [Methyloversatilis universalis FAM5]